MFIKRAGTDNPLDGAESFVEFKPVLADLDGDGDHDLLIGNLYYYENTGTATAPVFTQRTGTGNPLSGIRDEHYKRVLLPDLDADGDLDLVAVNGAGAVLYFENTGTAAAPAFTQRPDDGNPFENIAIEKDANASGSPAFADLDGDGDLDLAVSSIGNSIDYYENTGTATAPAYTQRTGAGNPFDEIISVRRPNPVFADIDNDGDPDLIVGEAWGKVHFFENTGTADSPVFTETGDARDLALTLYDSDGVDTLDLRTDTNDQRVYLRPEGISDVYGLTGNLVIARDTVIENFIAGSGNDVIVGNAVANYISGRDGDDTLDGGPGADMLDGGPGSDTASYQHSAAAVLVRLHDARAVRSGDAEGDTLTGIEHLIGSPYNDILAGDGEDNVLRGGGGHDDLYGGPAGGDDEMYGDNGDDRIFGGRGDDTLTGGEGNDLLKGGPGEDILIVDGDDMDVLYGGPDSDTFRFFPSDLGGGSIRDFSDGEDVIDLTEFTGISSMDDLDIVVHGDNVRIEVSGTDYLTTIILSDFDVNNLDNSDFMF